VKNKKKFFRDAAKENNENFPRPGKVLHVDGDSDYLDTCMENTGSWDGCRRGVCERKGAAFENIQSLKSTSLTFLCLPVMTVL